MSAINLSPRVFGSPAIASGHKIISYVAVATSCGTVKCGTYGINVRPNETNSLNVLARNWPDCTLASENGWFVFELLRYPVKSEFLKRVFTTSLSPGITRGLNPLLMLLLMVIWMLLL